MQPIYALSDIERHELYALLDGIDVNPYTDYAAFSREVSALVDNGKVPAFFVAVCTQIREERESGISAAHVVRNCPVDAVIPELDLDDPVMDKYDKKKTFIAEALLQLYSVLVRTPLLAYAKRNNGDFFTDVIAINRYSGQQTGFSDAELVYHNDRTAHSVRADYIALLGLRCPEKELVYTGFVDGRNILAHLGKTEQGTLRKPYFITPFDVFSRDTNSSKTVSDLHPILENQHSFRYLDTITTVALDSPPEAKDALIAMKNALVRAEKKRHRIRDGDLFVFANQDGLHNRDKIDIEDPERARTRWLLKTYTFRDQAAADRYADEWMDGVAGLVGD